LSQNNQILPYGDPLPKDYETLSRADLKAHLTKYIAELLEHNFEKLCSLIYRHDVDEDKFHHAIQTGTIEGQADRVAELVIERELQKVETRKAYRKHKTERENKELE
jgi:hypothetical protein